MQESVALPDPLLALRAAVKAGGDDPLKCVSMQSGSGEVVQSTENVRSIVFHGIDKTSLQQSNDASDVVFPADCITRVLRSRDSLTRHRETLLTPEAEPNEFMPLLALVFAIHQRDERTGAYLRNATLAEVVPLPALERSAVLDYLLGKRDAWEGIVARPNEEIGAAGPAVSNMESSQSKASYEGAVDTKTLEKRKISSGPGRPAYVPDPEDAEFVRRLRSKYEIVLMDRDDVLRGSLSSEVDDSVLNTRASSDLLVLRTIIGPRIEAAKRRSNAPPPKSSSSASAASSRSLAASSHGARKSRAQDPIILLSNSPTALINMFNVKALLQDGVFIHPDEARKQAGGIPELVVSIRAPSADDHAASSNTGTLSRRILVVDSAEAVNRLGNGPPGTEQDPWSRVIAVFTTGQAWQFKSYRWTDPRDLFRNGMFLDRHRPASRVGCTNLSAMGVYVRWNNETTSSQVKDWNVTHLQVRFDLRMRSMRITDCDTG